MDDYLFEIEEWLNQNYNQASENYSIINGAKPGIVKYDEHTIISFWGCGAIVCISEILYFIGDDDGHWFINGTCQNYGNKWGLQSPFSVGLAPGFIEAMQRIVDYTKEHGEPVYYSGTDIICHYKI